nr:PREDICTED: exonuclease 1 [Lepisosteus oculatus]
MGISGLLQFIKEASEPVNVKKYKGQTAAVDTYCWLHKGAFSCAEKLAKGEPTDQYVTYCMKLVDMLLTHGIKPILVFDGRNLPSKKDVEKARRERREANLRQGRQLLREGKVSEARDCFTRCVDITPAMAHDVIKAARGRGVDCVVAPYEADAQLAYLNKRGIAQVVITEDSDLLAFGCTKVLLKMDRFGNGLEIAQSCLGKCKSLGDVFTEEKFRYMCILSGCDYLASIHGIGLGKACKLLKMANNPDITKVIKKMGQYLNMSVTVSDEYIEGFIKANNTFLYQLVFDPLSRRLVPLNPYPEEINPQSLSYAGPNMGDQAALQIALGNVDVNSMKKIDDYNPDITQPVKPRSRSWTDARVQQAPCELSIWSREYNPAGNTRLLSQPSEPRSPETLSTRGKEKVISTQPLKLPTRQAQVKRPRAESSMSEEVLLGQYSCSDTKKPRREAGTPPAGSSMGAGERASGPASQHRARNRFATVLQRRNQEEGPAEEQGLCSRFFCTTSSSVEPEAKQESPVKSHEPVPEVLYVSGQHSETSDVLTSTDTEFQGKGSSRAAGETTPLGCQSPCTSSRGSGVFGWSGSLGEKPKNLTSGGLVALQQFQRMKESFSWSAPRRKPSALSGSLPDKENRPGLENGEPRDSGESGYFSQPSRTSRGESTLPDKENRPGSEEREPTDSQESGYFSQSSRPFRNEKDREPRDLQESAYFSQTSRTSRRESITSQTRLRDNQDSETGSQESDSSDGVNRSPVKDKNTCTLIKAKVSGLSRASAGGRGAAGKLRARAPARASGLRKRGSTNDENRPGLQATISDMWKNFGFRAEKDRRRPCRKGEPMSPVKDNVQSPAPESGQDIYGTPALPSV